MITVAHDRIVCKMILSIKISLTVYAVSIYQI
jgi:hypothetical protein